MSTHFVCDFSGFCMRKFPENSEKHGTFFSDCTWLGIPRRVVTAVYWYGYWTKFGRYLLPEEQLLFTKNTYLFEVLGVLTPAFFQFQP